VDLQLDDLGQGREHALRDDLQHLQRRRHTAESWTPIVKRIKLRDQRQHLTLYNNNPHLTREGSLGMVRCFMFLFCSSTKQAGDSLNVLYKRKLVLYFYISLWYIKIRIEQVSSIHSCKADRTSFIIAR